MLRVREILIVSEQESEGGHAVSETTTSSERERERGRRADEGEAAR